MSEGRKTVVKLFWNIRSNQFYRIWIQPSKASWLRPQPSVLWKKSKQKRREDILKTKFYFRIILESNYFQAIKWYLKILLKFFRRIEIQVFYKYRKWRATQYFVKIIREYFFSLVNGLCMQTKNRKIYMYSIIYKLIWKRRLNLLKFILKIRLNSKWLQLRKV